METPLDNEIVVPEVEKGGKFEEARKPRNVQNLWIDLGHEKVKNSV